MDYSIFLIVLGFLTLASGYFSSSEVALFSLSPMTIKSYALSKNSKKRLIAELVMRPRDLLVTIFMLNTLINILIQNVSSSYFGAAAGWGLKVGVPLFITLVFGEIIPKNYGMENNAKLSERVISSINFLHRLIAPIRRLTLAITVPISKLMFFYLKKEQPISKDQLQHVLETSQEQGVLNYDEAKLIVGYLNLQKATVKEVMWPREDILFYDINEPLSKLIYLFVDQECTRLPVCDKDFDHLLGVINAKTFLLQREKITSQEELKKVLKKPFFIPEATLAKQLYLRFEQDHEEFALVVDEYGTISGLITKEDLAEVVIGEIRDLRDAAPLWSRTGKEEVIVNGKLEISAFNLLFDIELKSEKEMVTVGGWILEQLGEIPKPGVKLQREGLLFKILSADQTRIQKIYVKKLKP